MIIHVNGKVLFSNCVYPTVGKAQILKLPVHVHNCNHDMIYIVCPHDKYINIDGFCLLGRKFTTLCKIFQLLFLLGQTNLISGSTDPTDPVFAESRKKIKNGPKTFICRPD